MSNDAIELLKEMEWVVDEGTECPVCCSNQLTGHDKDCKLHAILTAASKPAPIDPDWAAKIEVLKALAKDKSLSVRKSVAYNTDLPKEVIDILLKDESKAVLNALLDNDELPVDTLRKLSKLKGIGIDSLMRNPNTPLDVLESYYKERKASAWEHSDIASHRNASQELLQLIVDHYEDSGSSWVANTARRNPNYSGITQAEMAESKTVDMRIALAENANLAAPIAKILANDKNLDVRRALARSLQPLKSVGTVAAQIASAPLAIPEPDPFEESKPLTAYDIWRDMANSSDKAERQSAASNVPGQYTDILLLLAMDSNEDVVDAVACRGSGNLTAPMYVAIAKAKNWVPRYRIASLSECPLHILQLLARDPNLQVRITVAKNPSFIAAAEAKPEAKVEAIPDAPESKSNLAGALVLGTLGAMGGALLSAYGQQSSIASSVRVEAPIAETIVEAVQEVAHAS